MARRFIDRITEALTYRLPVDVMPFSNGEFIPPDPTPEQRAIMRIAREESDRAARRHGMDRRRFLQTAAAYAVGFAAINQVRKGGYAFAADGHEAEPLTPRIAACDLGWPGAQLNNLPGEFILDLQSHHVDADGAWRTNDGAQQQLLMALVFPQVSCGELDPMDCLGRFHYIKELFLDSSTNVCVLSAVPFEEDGNPLPASAAAETCGMVNQLAASRRVVMQRFVMPNRGYNPLGGLPRFLEEELDLMEDTAIRYGSILSGWKVYTPWGDQPGAGGYWLDDPVGQRLIAKVRELGDRYGIPKVISAHKGLSLPGFDTEKAAARDIGVVARQHRDVKFIVYHSCWGGEPYVHLQPNGSVDTFPTVTPYLGSSTSGPYPGEAQAPSTGHGVDNFITALRENGWSARHFAPGGSPGFPHAAGEGNPNVHANVPNVYAELGTVWRGLYHDPARASLLLGKLIYYVGPRRVVWGTDCLWTGSPQPLIVALRTLQMTEEVRQMYNLPYGLDGDVNDPTRLAPNPARSIRNGILGRNAAALLGIDPDATLNRIACDEVQHLRDEYLLSRSANHETYGPRTRRDLFTLLRRDPWRRGAVPHLNAQGFRKLSG